MQRLWRLGRGAADFSWGSWIGASSWAELPEKLWSRCRIRMAENFCCLIPKVLSRDLQLPEGSWSRQLQPCPSSTGGPSWEGPSATALEILTLPSPGRYSLAPLSVANRRPKSGKDQVGGKQFHGSTRLLHTTMWLLRSAAIPCWRHRRRCGRRRTRIPRQSNKVLCAPADIGYQVQYPRTITRPAP